MSTRAPAGGDDVIRDRYQLQSLLGHGGMGMVWSAHDRRLDRTVALKLLRPDVPESTAAQMEREARAAARIDDQRIVTVLDLDHMEDGRPFLVMELHDGWTLADEVRRGPLAPDRFQKLVDDLLGGLASAHDCGVLHRDIKPANVLAEADGFRITDFGLASIDTDQQTEPSLMGTLAYIAPERLHGTPGTYAADVFSAGVVLYEAATGHKPFLADTPADAIMAVRSRQVRPLPDHVPTALAETILLALDPDPSLRPANAGEMLALAHGIDARDDRTLVMDEPLDQTRPLRPVDVDGPAPAVSAPPRSGATRDLAAPRLPARAPVRWRTGALALGALFLVAVAFLLGAMVAGDNDASGPAPAPGQASDAVTEPATEPATVEDPAARLDEVLDEIEDLGR